MLDQPHNAKTIVRLGCAVDILPFSRLTATRLSRLITSSLANDEKGKALRDCATRIGEHIRKESSDSLDRFCSVVEETATNSALRVGNNATHSANDGVVRADDVALQQPLL